MTVFARRIRAAPFRTSNDAWALVVDLVSAVDERFRPHLEDVGDIAAMLIAEEHAEADPIILRGCGPLVHLYTLHGTDAIDGSNVNEQALQLESSDEWMLALPASGIDFSLATEGVSSAEHVTVYDTAKSGSAQDLDTVRTAPRRRAHVDLGALEA